MIDHLVFFLGPSEYFGRRGKNFPAYNMGPYGKISIWDLIFSCILKKKSVFLIINFFLNSHILIVKCSCSFFQMFKILSPSSYLVTASQRWVMQQIDNQYNI